MNQKGFFLTLKDTSRFFIKTPAIMEIINVTPDSFYDGGKYLNEKKILKKVTKAQKSQVAILDIGGESTRPFSKGISEQVEIKRVIPIIKLIKKKLKNILISIDTTKVDVAKKAIEAGADMINDISSGDASNNEMLSLACKLKTPIILMHKKGIPLLMQKNPHYNDVLKEVLQYLREKVKLIKKLGARREQIIIDPGIGFGKTKEHNIILVKQIKKLKSLGFPVLIGASMKKVIQELTQKKIQDCLFGNIGFHLAAINNGCDIIRVHHSEEIRDSIKGYQGAIAN